MRRLLFAVIPVFVVLFSLPTFAQDAVSRVKIKAQKSPKYASYVFENLNDSTYFYLKKVGKRKTRITILNQDLDTLYSKTHRKMRFDSQHFVKIQPFNDHTYGVYFYNTPFTGPFQLKSRLNEVIVSLKKNHIEHKVYKFPGLLNDLHIERFNNKTFVGGSIKRNLGFGVNMLRLSAMVLWDIAVIQEELNDDLSEGNSSKALFPASQFGPIPLFLMNTYVPFGAWRTKRNFLAELKDGRPFMQNGGRFLQKDIKKAYFEDMIMKGDTMLLAFTNRKADRPSIVIDALNKQYRIIQTVATKPDKEYLPLNVDLYDSSQDTVRFSSVMVARKGYGKGHRLMEMVYPRNYIHSKLTNEDVTENDDEFEEKAKKQKKKDKKNSKLQGKLSGKAKSMEGIYFTENVKGKKSGAKMNLQRSKGKDLLPAGNNFTSRTMFSNERIVFDTVNGNRRKYVLRQLYYVKQQTKTTYTNTGTGLSYSSGASASAAATMSTPPGGAAPMVTSQTQVSYYVITKNLSLRIEDTQTGDFSQFLIDAKYFQHMLSPGTNQIEKMHACLNVIDGKAYVSLVDKKKNLKTYRYTMDGGELIHINKLGKVTKISFGRKLLNFPVSLFFGKPRPFGYFDIDMNMGAKDSFVLTSYMKSPRDEDGKRLHGKKRYRFVIQKYQIDPSAPKIDTSVESEDDKDK